MTTPPKLHRCPRCHCKMSPAPEPNGDGTHHYECENCYYKSDYTLYTMTPPKPREFWVNPRGQINNPHYGTWHEAYQIAATNTIHVIEYSALESLKLEFEQYRKDSYENFRQLQAERERNRKLVEQLRQYCRCHTGICVVCTALKENGGAGE